MQHVIFLLHGIRDFGGPWMGNAKRIIEARPGVKVVAVRFGYYDVLSFLSPFESSVSKPYEKLLRAYESGTKGQTDPFKVSIVAHSFGTFLVGMLLKNNQNVRFHRILLCGSVLKQDFEWHNVTSRLEGENIPLSDRIRNECGSNDPWPAYAKILNSRYGDAGRHGFANDALSTTTHYYGGHSLFFEEQHIQNEWKPFLLDGINRHGNTQPPQATLLERITTWPFVTTAIRWAIVLPLWIMLYLWWILLPVLAISLYLIFFKPDTQPARQVDLSNYIANIRRNATTQDPDIFESFRTSLASDSQARISFDAAVARVDGTKSVDGRRSILLRPAECNWISSNTNGLLLSINEKDLPRHIDFTALEPRGSTFSTVRVVVEVENVIWATGKTDGRVFARAVKFDRLSSITCPDTSTE